VKVAALAALIVAGLFSIYHHNYFSVNFQGQIHAFKTEVQGSNIVSITNLIGLSLVATFAVSMVGSLFSSDAWNNITFIAGEVKQPGRNIPRSLLLGTMGVTII